jgi:NAD(P)-dependent dehydrogenase (short-subunit alcohol dehydrogenase family)
VVTGGAGGLGLTLAEALVEAGGNVYCLDRLAKPTEEFYRTEGSLAGKYEGSIHYHQVDVQDANNLESVIADIASKHERMDGLVAAAGVQNVTPALDYPPHKIGEVSEETRLSLKSVRCSCFADAQYQLYRCLSVCRQLRTANDQV